MSSDWSLEWLPSDRDGQSTGIRSSGLVHIVPTKLGPSAYYSVPLYPTAMSMMAQAATVIPAMQTGYRLPGPQFEERLLTTDECELAKEFEELSIKSDGSEKNKALRILESTVFAGRLNSQKISIDLLVEHFAAFGPVRYACLFNRGALTYEGGNGKILVHLTFFSPYRLLCLCHFRQ